MWEKKHQMGHETAQNQEHVLKGKKIGKRGVDTCCRNMDSDALKAARLWGWPAPLLLDPTPLKQTLFFS